MRLLVSSGETSGELYGAELVRQLRPLDSELRVFGLGGDRLSAEGASLQAHVRELAVVGLLEVLSHLPRIRSIFRSVLAECDRERPDLAVLIDYPDFNLRLARELRARGIPVVYYVSPQVWAWRKGRIRTIRERPPPIRRFMATAGVIPARPATSTSTRSSQGALPFTVPPPTAMSRRRTSWSA